MATSPDIVWILTTQWRAQAFGYSGDRNARTPHLDRLSARSTQFTQAVTPHPFGPFARAALLTGVPCPNNGVGGYFDPLPRSMRTIAHDLVERGYHTAFFGKWHLGQRDPSAPLVGEEHARTLIAPDARGGFEFWEGFESGFLLNDPWLHGTRLEVPQRFPGYQSDVICERASTYARAAKAGTPLFLIASIEAPHPPYAAPTASILPMDSSGIELSPNVPRDGEIEIKARRELAGYYAHIEATDRAIGRLVAALDEAAALRGRARPVIFFTSVHGDMHGAHGLFRKGWPHEESIRVPLLLRSLDEKTSGIRRHEAVSLLELPRMTLACSDGRPLDGGRIAYSRISMPSLAGFPLQCDRVWRGVRTPLRKLVLNADGSPWLFFNLHEDPLELTNRARDSSCQAEIGELRDLVGA